MTGRSHLFSKIRQYKGLLRFLPSQRIPSRPFLCRPCRDGAVLRFGRGQKPRSDHTATEHIMPILGDASLTCGLTLEALNNVSNNLPRFIAVLNDNARSISENVGNIKNILAQQSTSDAGILANPHGSWKNRPVTNR